MSWEPGPGQGTLAAEALGEFAAGMKSNAPRPNVAPAGEGEPFSLSQVAPERSKASAPATAKKRSGLQSVHWQPRSDAARQLGRSVLEGNFLFPFDVDGVASFVNVGSAGVLRNRFAPGELPFLPKALCEHFTATVTGFEGEVLADFPNERMAAWQAEAAKLPAPARVGGSLDNSLYFTAWARFELARSYGLAVNFVVPFMRNFGYSMAELFKIAEQVSATGYSPASKGHALVSKLQAAADAKARVEAEREAARIEATKLYEKTVWALVFKTTGLHVAAGRGVYDDLGDALPAWLFDEVLCGAALEGFPGEGDERIVPLDVFPLSPDRAIRVNRHVVLERRTLSLTAPAWEKWTRRICTQLARLIIADRNVSGEDLSHAARSRLDTTDGWHRLTLAREAAEAILATGALLEVRSEIIADLVRATGADEGAFLDMIQTLRIPPQSAVSEAMVLDALRGAPGAVYFRKNELFVEPNATQAAAARKKIEPAGLKMILSAFAAFRDFFTTAEIEDELKRSGEIAGGMSNDVAILASEALTEAGFIQRTAVLPSDRGKKPRVKPRRFWQRASVPEAEPEVEEAEVEPEAAE